MTQTLRRERLSTPWLIKIQWQQTLRYWLRWALRQRRRQ